MEILIPFGTNSNQTNLSPKILMMLLIPTITPRWYQILKLTNLMNNDST